MRFGAPCTLCAFLCLTAPARADLLVNVSKSQQRAAVVVNGEELYRWPVSTGGPGNETPVGEYRPKRLEREWFSRQYDGTPMPWAVFFHQGYAVHATEEVSELGTPVSHGCVHLLPANAAILFALVRQQGAKRTKIVITDGPLPPDTALAAGNGGLPARTPETDVAAAAFAQEAPPERVPAAAKADREDRAAPKADRADISPAKGDRAPRLAVKGDREDIDALKGLPPLRRLVAAKTVSQN